MKKIILSVMLFTLAGSAIAQDKGAVFSTNEIVWYGLDFSNAKFIGTFDQGAGIAPATGYDMKTKWIAQWNALIAKEQPHFDFRKAFQKDNVIYDLEPMATVNKKVDADKCMAFNANKVERADVEASVKSYPVGEKKEGIGCSFVVENFNKTTETASVWVTFFDIRTHKVLLCEKLEGKCMGIGMRNYWAGAIKSIIKQITESAWKDWKRG
jgi:hypothetical protein